MREILFRGKRVDNGEWVKGWFVKNLLGDPAIITGEKKSDFHKCIPVIPETVGQYTGEKYKTGEKIWEGDLFNHGGDIHKVVFISGAYHSQMIYYEWLNKDVSNEHKYGYIAQWKTFDTKYLGNIHDQEGEPETLSTLADSRLSKAIGAGGTIKALDNLGIVIKDKEGE